MSPSASRTSRSRGVGTQQTGSLSGQRICCKGHTQRRWDMTENPGVAIKKAYLKLPLQL